MELESTVVSDAVLPSTGRASSYRPSTELTSTAAPDVATPPRPRRGGRLLAIVGVAAFVLAFGGGLAVYRYRPSALPSGLVPAPPVVPSSSLALGPKTSATVGAGSEVPASSPSTEPAIAPPSASSVASVVSPPPALPSSAAPPAASEAAVDSSLHSNKHRSHRDPVARPAPSAEAPKVETPPSPPVPAGPDCSVPYTLDADGNKKWKMECLGH
jgi:serine/threonine-protein kinase